MHLARTKLFSPKLVLLNVEDNPNLIMCDVYITNQMLKAEMLSLSTLIDWQFGNKMHPTNLAIGAPKAGKVCRSVAVDFKKNLNPASNIFLD